MSRARAGKAASTRLIKWISTIEASSMMSTLASPLSASLFISQRCTVLTSTVSSSGRLPPPCISRRDSRVASCRRAAALPVGAAKAMSLAVTWPAFTSAIMILATVVVFPVPGPPEMQHKCRLTAACRIGMDPVELRRRNVMEDDSYPRSTASGVHVQDLSHQACLEQLVERLLQLGGFGSLAACEFPQPRRHRPFPPPHTIEIEPARSVQYERPACRGLLPGDGLACREPHEPGFKLGQHQVRRVGLGSGRPLAAGDLFQIDAGMSLPGVPARNRRGQRRFSIVFARKFRDHSRQMPIDFTDVALPEQRFNGGRERHDPPPLMNSSSASIHFFAGRSNQTPRAMPAAGSMPRRKR